MSAISIASADKNEEQKSGKESVTGLYPKNFYNVFIIMDLQ